MSVCWHELWGGLTPLVGGLTPPPTSHRQFQHWA